MNISDRVTELTQKMASIENGYKAQLRNWSETTGEPARAYVQRLGHAMAVETAEMRNELAALKAPIVSMLVHEGRILIATSGGVFELKGDSLIWLRFQVLDARGH